MAIDKRFDVELLDEARRFVAELNQEDKAELMANIKAAKSSIDSGLFKKITKEIWEFRARHNGRQFRLLAFWDKNRKAMVLATHGFIKKTQKTPLQEIKHAEQIMKRYYANN